MDGDGDYYIATFGYSGIWHPVEWMTHFTGLRIHGSSGWGGPAGAFLPRYRLLVAFRTTSLDISATRREDEAGRRMKNSDVALWEVKTRQAS